MIEGSALGYLLHAAFQKQGIEPGVLMGIRKRSDIITPGERAFILASTGIALEECPVKMKNNSLS